MATPIVFVPGLSCTERLYAHQADALGGRHAVLPANHWSASDMATIAEGILAEAPPRFSLVGTSMGGYVAFEILRQAAERVDRLVLISTSARPDTPERSEGRRRDVAAARMVGMKTGTLALMPKLVHPSKLDDPALRALLIEMAEEIGVEGFARQIDAIIARPDSRPLLSQIAAKTLVIVGSDDALIPPDMGREIAAAIPGAALEEIASCGHLCPVEQPETVTGLLESFLAD